MELLKFLMVEMLEAYLSFIENFFLEIKNYEIIN